MKIKVSFVLPKKDFSDYEYTILEVKSSLVDGGEFSTDQEWKVVIPDYMFNELADSEPQFKTTYDQNNKYSGLFSKNMHTRKFMKTQYSNSIESLKNYIYELSTIIVNRHSIETTSEKKKIFIKFNNEEKEKRYEMNFAYKGLEISQKFNYFIGYEGLTKKNVMNFDSDTTQIKTIHKKRYYTKIKCKSLTSLRELLPDDIFTLEEPYKVEAEYKVIDWTQEREYFLNKIQDSFKSVNLKLNYFFSDIREDNIDSLINNQNSYFNKIT